MHFVKLSNNSNVCYLNTIIQFLISIPCFRKMIRGDTNGKTLLLSFFRIYLTHTKKSSNVILNSEVLLEELSQEWPEYGMGNQMDAHELLIRLLEYFEVKMNMKPKIDSLFNIQFTSTVKCQCGYISTTHFSERYIVMDYSSSIQHVLETKQDILEDWKCERCQQVGTTIKILKTNNPLPPVLFVQIERFDMCGGKIDEALKAVDIKLKYSYMSRVKEYILRGVVVHIGQGIDCGHYVVLIWNDINWILIDDFIIKQLGEKEALHLIKHNAYILVYSSSLC